jgi:hypothetical protein
VTEEAGVSFMHTYLVDTPGWPMLGGGTVGDFDGDGWPDIFVIGGGLTPDRLFMNHGGSFVDEAAAWGLTDLYRGSGAGAADYDRDGDLDLMVTSLGDLPGAAAPGCHRLYRNDGGHFTNVAAAAGVTYSNPVVPDGYSPTFGDYDLDGDLDLWIGGWFALPDTKIFIGTRLFRNQGNGTFVDVTEAAGVLNTKTRGFSAIFADMDGDRYPELMVAGDFSTSRYYVNNRDGTFTERPFPAVSVVDNGMGTAMADFDRDGLQDWFVTAILPSYRYMGPPGNRLYFNRGNHELVPAPPKVGVNDCGWGWGATALDYDHDGWVDLFMTNGWPEPDIITLKSYEADPSCLFRNNGDGTFTNVSAELGTTDPLVHKGQGRYAGHLDYDRDGDLDILVLSCGEPLKLYRNDLSGKGTKWLQVRLHGGDNPRITPDGRGSTVRITSQTGLTQVAQFTGHSNYLGGNEPMVHFGLGAQTKLAKVQIDWSDGSSTILTDVAANQRLEVTAPDGPLGSGR